MSDYLTVSEVAARVKVTPETVRRWLRSGHLVGRQVAGRGGGWRVTSYDLDHFLGIAPAAATASVVPVDGEKVYDLGVIQDADGTMTAHMHPPGATLGVDIGGQKAGEPCIWCARGVRLMPAVRRVVKDGIVTIFDTETGDLISGPYAV